MINKLKYSPIANYSKLVGVKWEPDAMFAAAH
jgi:hypothetical protein